MSERDWRDWLADILDEADVIAQAVADLDAERFVDAAVEQRAVLHGLQTIGEAAGRLPSRVHDQLPEIPWAQIRGLRNRIVHGYFGIDLNAVWKTATIDAPRLAEVIRRSGLLENN